MPQLTQLPQIWWSQLFWLLVVFGIIFFVIGRGMLPKVQSTIDARDTKISSDLEAAQAARAAADQTEAAWRERMDSARAEASKLASEAKQASAQDTEAAVRAAAEKLNAKVEAAEAKIRKALDSARGEIEAIAVDATREMFSTLTGRTVDKNEAAEAVKAEMNV